MKAARVLAIARKQLLTLKHDKRSLALMLIAPIFAMLIFGFAFGNETHDVPTVIVDHDTTGLAADFVSHLDKDKLRVTTMSDENEAKRLVADGQQTAAIIFPADFGRGGNATLFLDTTNAQLAAAVGQAMAKAAQDLVKARGVPVPVAPQVEYAHPEAKDARFIDSFVPGIMAFAAMLFTTLLTLLAFVGERTSGTLDRLRVSPITPTEVVLGYEIAFGIIAAVQGLLLIAIAILVYKVLVVGSIALAALIVVLLALDAQAIGILISAGARKEAQAIQMIPIIILPTFLLSGIFVPVQSLPPWLRPFSYLLPPTWAIEAMRDVTLRGWGIDRIWLHLVVLAGFAIALTTLAVLGLRRSKA